MSLHILTQIFFKKMKQDQKILLLGYSGLIPFLAIPILSFFFEDNRQIFLQFFVVYSLGIYTFLTGNLWSMSINQQKEPIYPILLFFLPWILMIPIGLFTTPYISSILALVFSFLTAYLYEKNLFDQILFYKQMRFRLTMIVIICHLIFLISI